MGKVNKQAPSRHSNHHDQPNRVKKTVVRRQHSQNGHKSVSVKVKGKLDHLRAKSNGVSNNPQVKPKVPFSKSDQVLLIGEGDFSFALSLKCHHSVANLVATCFDSKDTLYLKYPNVAKTIRKLSASDPNLGDDDHARARAEVEDSCASEEEWAGFSPSVQSDEDGERELMDSTKLSGPSTVLYGIDATKLSSLHKKALRYHAPFTKIVFNFPHVGGLSTDVNRQVRYNQQLLVEFFKSAKPLLATSSAPAKPRPNDEPEDGLNDDSCSETEEAIDVKHGQILVTLFEGEPYTLWNIRDLARHCGLKVLESFKFPWTVYPGYQHARTIGNITTGKDRTQEAKRKGAWRGEERDARCYVLALKDDGGSRLTHGSRKRKKEENDSD